MGAIKQWLLNHPVPLWVALNFFAFFALFVPVSYNTDPNRAISLATSFDNALPFVHVSFWIYSFTYLSTFVVLFVIRSRKLFHRAGLSFFLVFMASVVVYLIIPVTTRDFRPIATSFDETTFLGWCLRLNWFLDRPYNCFPSLHVSAAFVAAFGCLRAHRRVGQAMLVLAVLISVSAMLMKQHYLADIVLGLAFATAAWYFLMRPWDPQSDPDPPAHSNFVMAMFFPSYAAIVALAYLLMSLGWRPWEGKPVY